MAQGRRVGVDSRDYLELDTALLEALSAGEVGCVFQPIVDLATRQVRGLEALARWEHPERGWISPWDFVPIAARLGVPDQLTDVVMTAAFRAWSRVSREMPDAWLSVNVFGSELTTAFPDRVIRLAGRADLALDRLLLEIAEQTVVTDFSAARASVQGLRELGVRVAIDAFGTRYGGLAALHQLPVDVVRICLPAVSDIGDDSGRAGIRSVTALCEQLGVDVVAECVETVEQEDLIVKVGCRLAQGYRYGRPAAIDAHVASGLPPHWP